MNRDAFRLLLVLGIIGGGIFWGYNYAQQQARKEQAVQFVRDYIRLVEANDLQTAYEKLTSKRFRRIVSFDKFKDDYNLAFRKLGQLKSYKPTLWSEKGWQQDHFVLDCEAQFQRDVGTIRFTLDRSDEGFQVAGFEIFSQNWNDLGEEAESGETPE